MAKQTISPEVDKYIIEEYTKGTRLIDIQYGVSTMFNVRIESSTISLLARENGCLPRVSREKHGKIGKRMYNRKQKPVKVAQSKEKSEEKNALGQLVLTTKTLSNADKIRLLEVLVTLEGA